MRFLFRAALVALPLLATACTEKPKATDPDKTATVISEKTMQASDSTAVEADTTRK